MARHCGKSCRKDVLFTLHRHERTRSLTLSILVHRPERSLCKAFVFRQWKCKDQKKPKQTWIGNRKRVNTNECHDRQWAVKSKIFAMQCAMAVNLGENIMLWLRFYSLQNVICFSWTTHLHQPNNQPAKKTVHSITDTAALFTKMCFFSRSRVRNVCVFIWVRAIVIRRRHHGTKHETKRNKIILWHQLMVLF